jgi:hypothetical protein
MSLLLALQGGGGPATIAADLSATEAQDVAAFSTVLVHVATFAASEAQDTASFSVALVHVAALAVNEAQDVAAFSGALVHVADFAATEQQDVAAFNASVVASSAVDSQQGGLTPFVSYWRGQRLARELREEESQKAEQAVREAAESESLIAEAVNKDRDITSALEARRLAEEKYREAYRSALLENYLEAAIIERFREDVADLRLDMKRRAALLLLLANS